jgi:hypothetical protein
LSSAIWTPLREALTKADATVDFRNFDLNSDKMIDMVTFLHSGYDAAGAHGFFFLEEIEPA